MNLNQVILGSLSRQAKLWDDSATEAQTQKKKTFNNVKLIFFWKLSETFFQSRKDIFSHKWSKKFSKKMKIGRQQIFVLNLFSIYFLIFLPELWVSGKLRRLHRDRHFVPETVSIWFESTFIFFGKRQRCSNTKKRDSSFLSQSNVSLVCC